MLNIPKLQKFSFVQNYLRIARFQNKVFASGSPKSRLAALKFTLFGFVSYAITTYG